MTVNTSAALALLCFLSYILYTRIVDSGRLFRLPPGPKQLPLLGNIHQISLNNQAALFAAWGKKHGDVVYVRLFQRPVVILNSLQAAQDLLEKRGSKYSDRPPFILAEDMYNFKPVTAFISTGEEWRRHRKWFQAAFETKNALDHYRPLQRREVDKLLSDLMKSPAAFILHIERFAGALMLEIAYGHSVTSVEDEHFRIAKDATTAVALSGSLVATLVDFFPILKYIPTWMPGGGFKRRSIEVRALVRQMMDMPFESVRKAMMSGSAKQSFMLTLIEEMSSGGSLKAEDEFSIKGACSQLFAAGSDTTISTLSTFVLAMTLYPLVYAKAQAELDRKIGSEQLPDLQDRDKLPYLECVLKEAYRWHPSVHLGIPHQTRQGDQYRGYHIPEGSTVISNIWSMSQDPSIYPDPEDFRPERHESMDVEKVNLTDPRKFVFGFGRRICPGRHFADSTIWLAMANMLATLDIRKPCDDAGREITPSASFVAGFVSHPKDFLCDIRPRTRMAADLIAQRVIEA